MEYQMREQIRRRMVRWLAVVLVLALLLITKPFVIVRAGDVGVIYSFGSIIGQVEEGFHLIAPWHFVTHTNIRVQRTMLEQELSPYSIHIVDLLLDNIDFSQEFKRSIENKQIATQKALEEEQLVAAEKFKAQQRVEAEKGEGEAKLARAEKEALANQKLAASLTPLLVQQAMIDKLSSKIQLMVVPQGQNFLMQLPGAGAK
jgi:regulator of protease activity HflC (stomatin/prohibitin superfamily)